jgi:uncharacterized protein
MTSVPLHVASPYTEREIASPVLFTSALLKVASRCNLDCDYCYVYKHADQSWRDQPHLMSTATINRFATRLREYLDLRELREFSVTFHGGEPLLFGGDRLAAAARAIRDVVGIERSVSFSLQTNGTLLTDEVISQLEAADIQVSLSLDGPKHINDRHRPDHRGRSTFEATLSAIRRLKVRCSPIFSGVIAVIDPTLPPYELFQFFAPLQLPRLDLLLPDATHVRLPPGRESSPSLYSKWIQDALRIWFHEFSSLPVRWFDALLASRVGVPSATDAMGLGSVSLIVVDTDGSYTDHDVFKITAPGAGNLGCTVETASFHDVSAHPGVREHCFRLTLPGLSKLCQVCPVVDACGGGSVMHRWHPEHKLDAPSIYCGELFDMLEAATKLVKDSVVAGSAFDSPEISLFDEPDSFESACQRWRTQTEDGAHEAAGRLGVSRRSHESAASILLYDRYEAARQSPTELHYATAGTWLKSIVVQSADPQLVAPFLKTIRVLSRESAQVQHGMNTLEQVADLLSCFSETLPTHFATLISDVMFVESTIEASDQIFSFSDDTAPNVLYVSPFVGDTPLGADDLADSLLHEFLHQVLYHIEREGPMLLDHVYPRFPAPWRAGLRPAGGFLHGTFVFTGLSQYWAAIAKGAAAGVDQQKAADNATRFARQAEFGIQSLKQFGLLTPRGEAFLDKLRTILSLKSSRWAAPCFELSEGASWRSVRPTAP